MKNNDTNAKAINKITLLLATQKDVLQWSCGEVTKPETINYKSYKPEKDGLFDELIFGPTTDYKCPVCGTKYKRSDENSKCVKTYACAQNNVVILPKISRRSRMGHIHLKHPVVHFWFFKIDHSIISKLLGLRVANKNKAVTKADLEKLIYYKSHIVLEDGGLKSLDKNSIIDISEAAVIYQDALIELKERFAPESEEYELISEALEELQEYATSKMGKDYGIDFYEYNDIIHEFSDAKISTGSEAIEYLLKNIDLEKEAQAVQDEINLINKSVKSEEDDLSTSKTQERTKLYKRLAVINAFIKSGQAPTDMLIYDLPVIPADLRPLVQLDGGRHSTSDINELYRRIIIRNNRAGKWDETDAPMLIKQNEFRMIQEAVDSLIDNARKKPNPVTSKDSRLLKSISDALTGKKGRFRQNLLGKRVDYSGRSVIVVGPKLKMYQVGVPREMAAKLFEPWIIKALIEDQNNNINSIKAGKKAIENLDPIIWPYVERAIQTRPVLLNRAPTLHRLSIQAFEPVLIRGKAIKLHPLVCTAFNADFDGDQMAIHVPISDEAVREARELMLASKNILGPKDGDPIINPSQDMILGIYYLTMEKDLAHGAKGEGRYFSSYDEMLRAYEENIITLHTRVVLPIEAINKDDLIATSKNPNKAKYIVSTPGKFILNNVFPNTFAFIFGKYVDRKIDYEKDGVTVKKITEKEVIHTSDSSKDLEHYLLPMGVDFPKVIANMPLNLALTKKDVAKIIRQVYDHYVAVITKEDIAKIIYSMDHTNYMNQEEACSKLLDYAGNKIQYSHKIILNKFLTEEYEKILARLMKDANTTQKDVSWFIEDYAELLENVWFRYTHIVADILDQIKDLGYEFSTRSGTTISIHDINIDSREIKEKIAQGDKYIDELKSYFNKGWLTDDERYTLTISKWSSIKDGIENQLKQITKSDLDNPLFMMFTSGARGNSSNFVQLAGMRGLMNNNTKTLKADASNDRVVRSTVEIPVKSSFLDGLTAYEFYSSTHGARKGLTDTALNTAKSGYLTRRLVDVAQGIVVREEDCGTDFGVVVKDIVDIQTNSVIEGLRERIEGRFANKDIFDKNGKIIIKADELITPAIADKIVSQGIKTVEIRSVLSCHTRNGVCKKCYGKDLAANRVVNIGEAVGIVAAQSIGEPGTQLTMRTFHTGGVAGVEDITGGFGRLIELIDAYDAPWGKPAIISDVYGTVTSINNQTSKVNSLIEFTLVNVEYLNEQNEKQTKTFAFKSDRRPRVKVGDKVIPGQKIVNGPIILNELLKVADSRAVQNYLLKEIQRLYRLQGITISDKYIEIIIRQLLSKILITDPGDSKFFSGSLVDILTYQNESAKLLAQGKRPPYGEVKIKGAKQIPLLSSSFLAAASYQETPKILVNSSISGRTDYLEGLKENIILGHKIPAGTNTEFELKGKYDIRDPKSYFFGKTSRKITVDDEPNIPPSLDDAQIEMFAGGIMDEIGDFMAEPNYDDSEEDDNYNDIDE
ncbi:DNA-directed RNA polymerase subunit beta' [Mycoplasmopsis lipophila]|uniref:DNA-directed RNA polymerase subunit beta' n=1 Tax=Mycoplasmopsis lipophila TaxID=2117 RepID=UPI00387395B9